MRVAGFFVLSILLGVFPAAAANRMLTYPAAPAQNDATRAVFEIHGAFFQPYAEPLVERSGQILKVRTTINPCSPLFCPPTPQFFSANLGQLEAGLYEVQLWSEGNHPNPLPAILFDSFELAVGPGPATVGGGATGLPYPFMIELQGENYAFAGVSVPAIVRTRVDVAPLRLGEIRVDGQEIRLEVVLPAGGTPVPSYDAVLVADLPPLPAGTFQIRVFAGSAAAPKELVAEKELAVFTGGAQLSYAGAAAPTAEGDVIIQLNQRPEAPPRVVKTSNRLRIFPGNLSANVPPGFAHEVNLGKLDPGRWLIELESYDGLHDQLWLEVLPAAPAEPLVLAGEFEVVVTWENAAGETGEAKLVQPPSRDSALFYFFSPDNWELMIKVLDGCAINGHFWVFAAASTDVGYSIEITRNGSPQTFHAENEVGVAAPAITNITAFPCNPTP